MIRYQILQSPLNWLPISMILLLTNLSACHTGANQADMQLSTLFRGYQLLLIDSLPPDRDISKLRSQEFHGSQFSDETQFKPGRVYIFRKLIDTSEYEIGKTIIPDRLKAIGANIIRAPKSPGDFVDIYVGGPLFTIEFELNGHRGIIRNDSHIMARRQESWYELFVVWQ